jgi:hypothetical protein
MYNTTLVDFCEIIGGSKQYGQQYLGVDLIDAHYMGLYDLLGLWGGRFSSDALSYLPFRI